MAFRFMAWCSFRLVVTRKFFTPVVDRHQRFLPFLGFIVLTVLATLGLLVLLYFLPPRGIGHFFRFLAVLAESRKFLAVGAPLEPGFLIFSPLPALILFLLA